MFSTNREREFLPTTGGGADPYASYGRSSQQGILGRVSQAFRGRRNDGSAASIQVAPPIVKSWQRSSVAFRRCMQLAVGLFITALAGYRMIAYHSAYIHLNCLSTECHITIQPVGWSRPLKHTISRSQLVQAMPVKTLKDGSFVTDRNVSTDDYARQRKDKKKKNKGKKTSNYKGPDDEGFYISYGVYFRELDPNAKVDANHADIPPVSLAPMNPYLTSVKDEYGKVRLTMSHFGNRQSRRRVRTMVQKTTSYAKRRRQKLVIKESRPPSWQGIVLMVIGIVGGLLCVLLGFVWDEDDITQHPARRTTRPTPSSTTTSRSGAGGPGARRASSKRTGVYAPQVPSQYEVVTSSTLAAKKSLATTRKRFGGY